MAEKPEEKKSKLDVILSELSRLTNLIKGISEVQANHEERIKELEKEMW